MNEIPRMHANSAYGCFLATFSFDLNFLSHVLHPPKKKEFSKFYFMQVEGDI
jgi:hypothetical protein